MVRELIFHLGDCKTGSTALQSVLSEGRAKFADGRTYHYTARFNHCPLARAISRLPNDAQQAQYRTQRWRQVAKELRASDADWGIISAEDFEFVPPAAMKAALDEFFPGWKGRTRFLSYVRPHPERIVSAYAERAKKNKLTDDMAAFATSRERSKFFHFQPRFQEWRDTFGDAFTLRPFIRDRLVGRDIVTDALTWLVGPDAGPDSFTFTPGTLDNSALSLSDLALMQAVHTQIMRRGGKKTPVEVKKAMMQLGWNFAPILSRREGVTKDKLAIDRALATRLAQVYAEDASELDATFFAGMGEPMTTALAASVKTAIDAPQSLEVEDYFSPREIGLIRAWADFTGRVVEADPTHFMWASKPPAERRENLAAPGQAPKRPQRGADAKKGPKAGGKQGGKQGGKGGPKNGPKSGGGPNNRRGPYIAPVDTPPSLVHRALRRVRRYLDR